MTLATRIIGTLLMDGSAGQAVHRERFQTLYARNPPITQARIYARREMDEICVLDVTATVENREPDFSLITEIVESAFLPVSYGGGVGSVEEAMRLVAECGVDKVIIGTRFDLLGPIAERLGRQAAVASVDDGRWVDSVAFAQKSEADGAGEILLQSIDRDGTLSGYNLGLIEAVSRAVSVPVIASSGCGKPDDMVAAMRAGASAVAAGWMWDATGFVPLDCKRALRKVGYPARISREGH